MKQRAPGSNTQSSATSASATRRDRGSLLHLPPEPSVKKAVERHAKDRPCMSAPEKYISLVLVGGSISGSTMSDSGTSPRR